MFVRTFEMKTIVSTHSRLKAAAHERFFRIIKLLVSTHSRLKAAERSGLYRLERTQSFNTQPPEGGWFKA